jgi:hypothetical protein
MTEDYTKNINADAKTVQKDDDKKSISKSGGKLKSAVVKDIISQRGRTAGGGRPDDININPVLKIMEASERHAVVAFGRMNPPTTGHEKLIHKVEDTAKETGGEAHIIATHTEGNPKNPLPTKAKVGYIKKFVKPDTKVISSSKDSPTLLHQLSNLHNSGVKHVTMVAGSDRVREFHDLIHKYNGKQGAHGHYDFKSIKVVSAGGRDPDAEGTTGISGTKMREYAHAGNEKKFKSGLPKALHPNAKEIMGHITKTNESFNNVFELLADNSLHMIEESFMGIAEDIADITEKQYKSIEEKSIKSGIDIDRLIEEYKFAYVLYQCAPHKNMTAEQWSFSAINTLIANEDATFTDLGVPASVKLYAKKKPETKEAIDKNNPDSRLDASDSLVSIYTKDTPGQKNKQVKEDLRKWFKDRWVRMDSKGNIKGDCAREPGEAKPKCLPVAKATAMNKDDRAAAVRKKRREDPVADRAGKGESPVFVRTEASSWAQNAAIAIAMKKAGKTYKDHDEYLEKMKRKRKRNNEEVEHLEEKNAPTNPALWSRAKSLARSKFDVYPSAYANGWASKWYKSKGGGWKAVSEETVNEISSELIGRVNTMRRLGPDISKGISPTPHKTTKGAETLAKAVDKVRFKSNVGAPPMKEDIDSMFEEKFGKEREAVARSGQDRKKMSIVPRNGEDRKTDDRFYRQQSIEKKVIEGIESIDELSKEKLKAYTTDANKQIMSRKLPLKKEISREKSVYTAQKKIMKKIWNEAKDKGEYDYEGDMAMSQLRSIMHNAQQIHDMLKPDTNMPEWVQSKITLAADYISTCSDYLQSNEKDLGEDINTSFKDIIK